jgi:Ni/Co efflux regulator RcnB
VGKHGLPYLITGADMKNHALAIAIAAACLTTGTSAMAQSYDDRGDRYDRYHDRYEQQRDYRDRDNYRGYRHHMRGAGPYHDLRRGDRLPMAFWGRQFRINDWHRARLSPPIPGSNWVRVGDDYVQVSVSTGLITAVMLRH